MESRMPYSGTDNPAAAAGEAAARAHNALDTAVDKAAPAVNRFVDKAVDKAHSTIDRVAQSAIPAAEAVQSAVSRTQDASARMMDACAVKVREQPLAAIGVAAAIGYIVGRLTR